MTDKNTAGIDLDSLTCYGLISDVHGEYISARDDGAYVKKDAVRELLARRAEPSVAADERALAVAQEAAYPYPGECAHTSVKMRHTDQSLAFRAGWQARAALASPAVPEGYKLVPIEPTPDMEQAGANELADECATPIWAHNCYCAMLRASPAVSQKDGAAVEGRDWIEDASHENGNYQCLCSTCGNTFIGHKRRVTCKACAATTASAIESIADELEAEASNYEGDFADTVKGCAEALHKLASPAAITASASIGDDPKFRDLAVAWASKKHAVIKHGHQEAWDALIGYLDSRAQAPRREAAQSGALIVSTSVNDDAVYVVVSAKQGDSTTVLYNRRHALNSDSIGTAPLAALARAPLPGQEPAMGAGVTISPHGITFPDGSVITREGGVTGPLAQVIAGLIQRAFAPQPNDNPPKD